MPCVPSEGECAGGPSEVLLLGDPGGVAEGSLSFGFTFCSNEDHIFKLYAQKRAKILLQILTVPSG